MHEVCKKLEKNVFKYFGTIHICRPTNMIITEPIVTKKFGYQFDIPIGNGVEDCYLVHFLENVIATVVATRAPA